MGYSGKRLGGRAFALSLLAVAGVLAADCASLPTQVASPAAVTPTGAGAAAAAETSAATATMSETETATPTPTPPAESLDHAALLDGVLYGGIGPDEARALLTQIGASGDTRFVGGLIDTLRYQRGLAGDIGGTLNELTGQELPADWFEWVEWAGQHPEIESFADYPEWKARLYSNIDVNFLRFLYPGVKVAPDSRVEEIVWGGVRVDGIPALDNPTMIDPADADYLVPDERVFGVSINGDTRAYPARFLDWHEMFNDVVGGEPVSLAY